MLNLDLEFVRRVTVPTVSGAIIQPSPIHGFGLFAQRPFRQREMLCILDGQILEVDEYATIKAAYDESSAPDRLRNMLIECNGINGKILARGYRTHYSYINHGEEPNVHLVSEEGHPLMVRAMRDIAAGEEFIIDYRKENLPLVGFSPDTLETLAKRQ